MLCKIGNYEEGFLGTIGTRFNHVSILDFGLQQKKLHPFTTSNTCLHKKGWFEPRYHSFHNTLSFILNNVLMDMIGASKGATKYASL